ncbi:MAG: PEP-CTERM sorting domain-containing protein [Planctomycetia bacterium]|nr:PEP-CTERM sorting domain-containing protein [Planctomycetia bacterium]
MFRLCFVTVLCLFSSTASAIVVSEGDYYEKLVVEGEFLMTGGVVEDLKLFADASTRTFYIEGGTVGVHQYSGIWVDSGTVDISGGTIFSGIERQRSAKVVLHGSYFQYVDKLRDEHNSHQIRGWLDDGSFINIGVVGDGSYPALNPPIEFVITPSDGLRGDTDGDWSVGIGDLNAVRNNFGDRAGREYGDVDDDGDVDVSDLNIVRNAFNPVQFFDPAGELPGTLFEVTVTQSTSGYRTSINLAQPVPEPSTFGIMALGAGLLSCALGRRRYWKSRFR